MPPISRRTILAAFLKTSAALAISTAASGSYSVYAEPNWLSVERRDVRIPNLPPALAGLRIAHLSDLHASPETNPELIAAAVAACNRERPDLVALTGDYVSNGLGFLPDLAPLASLRAPLGVYGVLGNHDHWSHAPSTIADALSQMGVHMLTNASARVTLRGGGLWIAGVDDVWEKKHDLAAALHGITPGDPTVLLAHEPDFADIAAQHGVRLQLSGHSHGGQVRLPFVGAPFLPPLAERYPVDLQRVAGGDAWVYTSRGIGNARPAVRFSCRPEVTILRLA